MSTIAPSALRGPEIHALTSQIQGDVAWPADPAYEDSQPWDRAVESRPWAVVFAESAGDIAAAVTFARAHGLRVAVRSTGHGALPIGDDVLLVHTGRMTDCVVDGPARRARVGAGAQWQQVLDEACPAGLAPLCGSAPGVGVVGLLTGGGLGPFARTYGVSSDSITALDVVTGDGELRHVTPTEHVDLFWGLRGGKATLGIVTAVEFDLPQLSDFYGGSMWFAGADRAAVLAAWRRMASQLPEQGTTSAAIMNLPPLPHVPAPIAGRQTVSIRFAWTGDASDGEMHLAELRRSADRLIDDIHVRPYAEIARIHGDPIDPMPVRSCSALLGDLPPEAVSALVDAVGDRGPHTIVELRALGGAIARTPRHASAVCHRDAAFSLFLSAAAQAETATEVAGHAERVLDALAPWTMPALLPNFAASDDPDTIARCYDSATALRLEALADQYDPDHVLATGQVARFETANVLTGREIR
jgi:FAD/FMN-containing dehydrogenase